jgi:hypothetical protein
LRNRATPGYPGYLIGSALLWPTCDGGRRSPRPMRPAEVRIPALALGMVLLLVAALTPFLLEARC